MDFRLHPGEVLDSVALGKSFIITKRGVPIAYLCQPPCDLSEDWFPKRNRLGGQNAAADCSAAEVEVAP